MTKSGKYFRETGAHPISAKRYPINKHIFMNLRILWFAPLVALAGCKDEAEQIPAYLRIEPFTVNAVGGAGWQKITDGWVYVNNELLGGFSLPATIPVLAGGESKVLVFPGVKENGLQSTPSVYPFMTRYEVETTLTPAQTTTVQPATNYAPNVIFPWSVERAAFNNTSILLEDRDTDTLSTFELTTDGAFEGRSVKLHVDTAHTLNYIATEQLIDLPVTNAQPVWLEMHYKNDISFELWLLGSEGNSGELPTAVYQFVPSENWNKIYLNLTQFLITLNQDRYRLLFRVNLPRDDKGNITQNSGAVFLDNLRVVHF